MKLEELIETGEHFSLQGFPVFQFNNKFYLIDFEENRLMVLDRDPRTATNLNLKKDEPSKKTGFNSLVLFPTERCNFSCLYCYAAQSRSNIDLTEKLAITSVDLFLEQFQGDKVNLYFHGGGEPTLNFDVIRKTVEYIATKKAYQGGIISNGSADLDNYNWLFDHGVHVTFSLDGDINTQRILRPTSETLLNKIYANLRELGKNYPLSIRPTITLLQLNKIETIMESFAELGVKRILLEPLYIADNSRDSMLRAPSASEFLDRFPKILDLAKKYGMSISRSCYVFAGSERNYHCNVVNGNSMVVTANGNLTGCFEVTSEKNPYWNLFNIGYIDQDKKEITVWQDKLDILKSRNSEALDSCQSCFSKHICAGGCTLRMLKLTGDLYKCDKSYCQLSKGTLIEIVKRTISASV